MKNKKMKKALCLLLAGVMVFGATACGSSDKKDSGGEKAKEQVLRLAISGEPTILDPFQIQDDTAYNISYTNQEPSDNEIEEIREILDLP